MRSILSTGALATSLTLILSCTSAVVATRNAARDDAMQLSLQKAPINITSCAHSRNQYQLDPNWDVYAPRQTREHYWEIGEAVGAPDGYKREMLAVNGCFPRPLIEANMGDRIIVHVKNNLKVGTGIHWHGLDQVGTNFMDGLTGINQCPIPANSEFTYNFTIDGQYGTYWWHSHYSVQYTDGLQGPLVVHSVDDPLKGLYDSDQVIMVDDWWHDFAAKIASDLLNKGNYDGHGNVAPSPDSTLINGHGHYNCPAGDKACDPAAVKNVTIEVAAGQRHRLRFINSGSHAQQFFSVDEHPLKVIEADDTPVDGPVLHRVPIHDGQRYSVLLDTTEDKPGDAFWMRSYINAYCLPYNATDLVANMTAIVRITENGTAVNHDLPTSIDWTDPTGTEVCVDIPTAELVPFKPQNVPQTVQQNAPFTYRFNGTRFVANNVSYINHPYDAVLYSIFENQPIDNKTVTTFTFNTVEAIDLLVNNGDANPGIDHPVHLHGRSFWVVAESEYNVTPQNYTDLTFNTVNPLRRDVIVIPRGQSRILRILTDDPGVWGMHCHIAWHLAEGFLGAVIIQPDEIRRLTPPDRWFQDCRSGNSSIIIPGLLPEAIEVQAAGTLGVGHYAKYWWDAAVWALSSL